MQTRHVQARCIADVVQPRGSVQQVRIRAENSRQALCPGGDTLDVSPAAGERFLQECPGELLCPGCQRGHAAQAKGGCGGTFTDVAGRPETSCSAQESPSSGGGAGHSEMDPAPFGVLQIPGA